MTVPNRAIAAYIPPIVYEKLTATMDLDVCWSLFRKFIGHQLFGPAYVSVPFITAADYFNQLFVFVKEQASFSIPSMLAALKLCTPTYKIIGNLDYMINDKLSTWKPRFDISPWDVMDGLSLAPDLRLRLDSPALYPEVKSVELHVKKSRIRFVEVPQEMVLHLHMNLLSDLKGAKHIYLITEVVYATYVKFTLRVGAFEKHVTYERNIPIGIKYRKYQVGRDGQVLKELPTKLRYGLKDVCWLRPEVQPIPKVLRCVEDLNREIKVRTVLTVTASETDGNRQSASQKTRSPRVQSTRNNPRRTNNESNLGPNLREQEEEDGSDDDERDDAIDNILMTFSPPARLNSNIA